MPITSTGAVTQALVQAELATQGRQVFGQGIDGADQSLAIVVFDLVVGFKTTVFSTVFGQDFVNRREVLVHFGCKGLVALFDLGAKQIKDFFAPSTLPWKS